MKVATWNVNSVKQRLSHLLDWLEEAKPDIVLLQETKVTEDNFPRLEVEAAGYRAAVVGQKGYNGVAILARQPVENVMTGLPGAGDGQARFVEGTVGDLRVTSLYVPNGNPFGSDRFRYKLAWLDRLREHVETLLTTERPFVLGGDFNVAPTDDDVYDPEGWADDALCRIETREKFRALLNLGLTDAWRALHGAKHVYTFWDYQRGAWQQDQGLRIDHLLLSPQAADRLEACGIAREVRGRPRASDHAPVWCDLAERP